MRIIKCQGHYQILIQCQSAIPLDLLAHDDDVPAGGVRQDRRLPPEEVRRPAVRVDVHERAARLGGPRPRARPRCRGLS